MDQRLCRRKTTRWSAAESVRVPAPGPPSGRLPGRRSEGFGPQGVVPYAVPPYAGSDPQHQPSLPLVQMRQ
jgi:hypothetical protein